jgi:hypothetical protein
MQSSAWLKRDTGTDRPCGSVGLEQGINTDRAGKILGRALSGRL